MLEDLHIGAAAQGSDGQKLGALTRIVVEQESHTVTHLVVDPGLVESGNLLSPGGWDKPRERLVPVALLRGANEHTLTLACTADELKGYPLFESESYGDAPLPQESRFRLGELLKYIASAAGVGAAPYESPREQIQFNEAPGSAEISEGTTVWRVSPHEEIGEVERVLVDEGTGRLLGLVVRRKGLGRETLTVPVDAIASIGDGVVRVTGDGGERSRR